MSNEALFQEYAELSRRIKAGDQNAFAEMYQKSARLVYGTCFGILRNEEDARDAMQETYISCYRNIGSLSDDKMFLGWIKKIAATRSLNLFKKNHGDLSYDDTLGAGEENTEDADLEDLPDAMLLKESDREILQGILRDSLSEVQYQTVLLYYYDELPIETIAEIMNCPVGTVKTRLMHARVKIKAGVEMYEEKTGDKIKVAIVMPFMTRFFVEEASHLTLPLIDPFKLMAQAASDTLVEGISQVAGSGTQTMTNGFSAATSGNAATQGISGAADIAAKAAAGSGAASLGAGVDGVGKTSFLSTVAGKFVACFLAGLLLVGGIVLLLQLTKQKKKDQERNEKSKISSVFNEEEEEKNSASDKEGLGNTSSEDPNESVIGITNESGAETTEASGEAVTETTDPAAASDPAESDPSASETLTEETYNEVGPVAVEDLPEAEQLGALVFAFKSEYDHTDIPDNFVSSQLVTAEYGPRLPFEYYFTDYQRGTGMNDPEGNFDKTYCARIYMPYLEWAEEYILNISDADRERINAEERFEVVEQSPTNRQGAYIGEDDYFYFWQGGIGNTESTIVIAASFDGEVYTIYTTSYNDFDVDMIEGFDPVRDGVWSKYTMTLKNIEGKLYWSILDCHIMEEHDESVLSSVS